MPVQLKIQLVSLAEGKQLLREVQRRVVQQQATAFLARARPDPFTPQG